jgi:sugar phosphate isomerase/epimerase
VIGPSDLDALIGELRLEAARRRASPSFPLEQEVRLGEALDAQAPPSRAPRAGTPARGWRGLGGIRSTWSASRGATPTPHSTSADPLQDARLDELERRLIRLERLAEAAGAPVLSTPGFSYRPSLPPGLRGRVLYWSADPGEGVAALRAAGLDAYGVDPGGDQFETGPDVRHAELAAHLRSVGALGAAVLVGPSIAPGAGMREVVEELARAVQQLVIVASEAPGHWRSRVGVPEADLATHRPVEAETWLGLLAGAGFSVTAEYPEGAAGYTVTARKTV